MQVLTTPISITNTSIIGAIQYRAVVEDGKLPEGLQRSEDAFNSIDFFCQYLMELLAGKPAERKAA